MKRILYSLLVILLANACQSEKKNDPSVEGALADNRVSLTATQMRNAGIVTGSLEQKQLASFLHVNGKIDVPPQNIVSISIPLGGYLKTTELLPGRHVSKGEVIAVIEDQQYIQLQQDFLSARIRIRLLEKDYKRQQELNRTQSSSDKNLQEAESAYESQKVLLASLGKKLELAGISTDKLDDGHISKSINVHSPINGYVSKVNVNIGKYVSPTDVLFELINPDDIHLTMKVYEKDLHHLFVGQKVKAYTNNNAGKKYDCEILLIGKDISPERNTEVHCHFENYDKSLLPGTYMNAEVEIRSGKSQVLPSAAVVRYEGKEYIFRAVATTVFEMTGVQTGLSQNGFTEIIPLGKPLSESANYVREGAYALLMKMKNREE